jgi:hypothetical protein
MVDFMPEGDAMRHNFRTLSSFEHHIERLNRKRAGTVSDIWNLIPHLRLDRQLKERIGIVSAEQHRSREAIR